MDTDRSFEVISGGAPSAEEVAAIAAALAIVLAGEPEPRSTNRWRWSGRWWDDQPAAGWRDPGSTAHPSQP